MPESKKMLKQYIVPFNYNQEQNMEEKIKKYVDYLIIQNKNH